MKEKGHCNLRLSTFSRLGRTEHLFFGDFLKYNEKKLVSGKPDVVIETTRKTVTLKNPSILNTPDHERRSAQHIPKKLNDCAVFIACGRTRKHIINLNLSPYLKTMLEDDAQSGHNVHIFDFEFKDEYQFEKNSVEGISRSMIRDLDRAKKRRIKETIHLKSDWKNGLFMGKIIAHKSIHRDEYIKATNSDPLWREALKEYFDPLGYQHYKEKYGLGNYLQRFRECDVPL